MHRNLLLLSLLLTLTLTACGTKSDTGPPHDPSPPPAPADPVDPPGPDGPGGPNGPGGPEDPEKPGRPPGTVPTVVNIGLIAPYSGVLQEFGPQIAAAVQLAVRQLNDAATEVFGGPIIELVTVDSGTEVGLSISRARELIDRDNVIGIIGPLTSGGAVGVAEAVSIPRHTIQIAPAASTPVLTELDDEHGYVFRSVGSDALQGIVGAQLARGEIIAGHSFNSAAVIHVDNPYGNAIARAFAAAFQARGGTITAIVSHRDESQVDYRSELQQLLAANPEVVLAVSYPGHAVQYIQEAQFDYGFTSWQFVDGTQSSDLTHVLDTHTQRYYGTAAGLDRSWPGWQSFTQAYCSEEPQYCNAVSANTPWSPLGLPFLDSAYDAAATLGLAIAQAHSDGVEISSANVRTRLREVANGPGQKVGVGEFVQALNFIKTGTTIDYSGAAGEVDYDASGDVITPVEIWQYVNNQPQTVMIRGVNTIPAQ